MVKPLDLPERLIEELNTFARVKVEEITRYVAEKLAQKYMCVLDAGIKELDKLYAEGSANSIQIFCDAVDRLKNEYITKTSEENAARMKAYETDMRETSGRARGKIAPAFFDPSAIDISI